MAGNYGDLLPVGGGDPIELFKSDLLVGRRESCDIVLRFSNVSAHHCQLFVQDGYWYVRTWVVRTVLRSTASGQRIKTGTSPASERQAHDRQARVSDSLFALRFGGRGPAAGRAQICPKRFFRSRCSSEPVWQGDRSLSPDHDRGRFDVMNNDAGQIKRHDRPV